MITSRRRFLGWAAATGTLAAGAAAKAAPRPVGAARIRAIAFDAFPILDPRPVQARVESLFPGLGASVSATWRTRQFEYQWLRALSGQYADFEQATADALDYAAEAHGIALEAESRAALLGSYLELTAWPDVPAALETLRSEGTRLALLSNATPRMLAAGLSRARLRDAFDHVISTDVIRSYKPDPRAYELAVNAFGLDRTEILFVAFAGWDAAGARAFGYPTYWVNRQGLPAERLGVAPDGVGTTLDDLVAYVRQRGQRTSLR